MSPLWLLVAVPVILAALGYYLLPFWAVLAGFSVFPVMAAAVFAGRRDGIGMLEKKLAEAEGRLQALQSDHAKGAMSVKELGAAYGQARAQLSQAQAENVDLRQRIDWATSHIDALKMEELISAQLRQKVSNLEKEKASADSEVVSLKRAGLAALSELTKLQMQVPGLERQVSELKHEGLQLKARTRVAEDYARARANWVPFAISDDDFAVAVAKVFK